MPTKESGNGIFTRDKLSVQGISRVYEFYEFVRQGFLTTTLLEKLTTLFSTVSLCDPPENVTARVDAQVSV